MERKLDIRLGVLTVLLQVLCIGLVEPTPCSSGFASDQFLLIVHRAHLSRNYRIGTVVFNDCSGRTRTMFESGDKRFQVDMDGTVKLKRGVTLHTGHETFTVHAWDSKGKKHSALVRVEYENWAVAPVQTDSSSAVLVLEFPYSGGLRRRKREWVIPPVRILENERGPFPSKLVQIKSSYGKETTMEYKITGEGANEDPVGIFTIDKITGWLYVSKPLDREDKAEYKLQAHAYSPVDESIKEDAMDVIVQVLDQNDNTPVFTQNPFIGSVPESSKKGFEFMTVNATDADAPNSDNSDIRYSILSQLPEEPNPHMFEINPITGAIRVNNPGMDREKFSQYNLEIQAADMKGEGRSVTGKVVITVTDSNDNAPQFDKTLYEVSVPENKVNALVVKMQVTDGDDPQSSAWATKFKIVDGNNGGYFSVNTGPNKQEGILTTVKALDFETNSKYTLLVAVENEIPFAVPLLTATATVIVNVEDVNEAPIFNPEERTIFKPEDLADEAELVLYTATDPDIGKNQKVTYRIGDDQAGWLKIDANTGFIRVKSRMDRESHFLKDGKYKALIFAVDDDLLPATGTGTLLIELEDVNDCAPVIDERAISICNKEAPAVLLSVTDKDGPGFGPPFNVDLQPDSRNNWTARMNDTKTGILLVPKISLEPGIYNVGMKVFDNGLKSQVNTIQVSVCDCKGSDFQCRDKTVAAFGLPGVLGILGAILGLLLLVLLLLLFLRRRGSKKEQPLITDDDIRDNVYYYDEEGGGEDDQDYDLSVLHRGLDNRPDVFRNDVAPTFMAAPRYRPRPANPDEIGNFIDDNLKAADNDPTAPPYDSLLVFDYEGGGSEAGSLSSLNSSGSGDQDYDSLAEWGPRFKKLADMYGGGED